MEQGSVMMERKPTAALEDTPVFHPLLLAMCPILGLYAYNVDNVPWTILIRPLVAAVVVAEIVLLVLRLCLRDKHKAGIVTSALLLALIWGWGLLETSISTALPYLQALGPLIVYGAVPVVALILAVLIFALYRENRRRALMNAGMFLVIALASALAVVLFLDRVFGTVASTFILVYLLLVGAIIAYLVRWKRDFKPWTRTGNWFGVILIVLYLALILFNAERKEVASPPPLEVPVQHASAAKDLPDIYLFVLDGYARCDVLLKLYSYNDLPALESLQQLGMTFSSNAFSNYAWDLQSAASFLNMDYLDRLLPPGAADEQNVTPLISLCKRNRFFQILREHGYEIVAYSPGVQVLEPGPQVDRCLSPPHTLSEFEVVLLQNAASRRAIEMTCFAKDVDPRSWPLSFRRARIQYAFDNIGEIAAQDHASPRLVFAHLTVPNVPFIFERKGGVADSRAGKPIEELYLDQVHYTSKMLTSAVAQITGRAKRPSVILIVSSHGPGLLRAEDARDPAVLADRFGVLLGVRYPETKTGEPAATETALSLVNTLRTVLNRILGAELPMLEDTAYLTSQQQLLEGEPVTIPTLETAITPVLEDQ